MGLLIAPFARMQARKQVPKDQARLKEILERAAPASGEAASAPGEAT
jgi:hypothetical protein